MPKHGCDRMGALFLYILILCSAFESVASDAVAYKIPELSRHDHVRRLSRRLAKFANYCLDILSQLAEAKAKSRVNIFHTFAVLAAVLAVFCRKTVAVWISFSNV